MNKYFCLLLSLMVSVGVLQAQYVQPAAVIVSGTVLDAYTRQPVPVFKIERGTYNYAGRPTIYWNNAATITGSDGQFTLTMAETPTAMPPRHHSAPVLRVSGYAPVISAPLTVSSTSRALTFTLKPAADLDLKIITPDGQPAADAKVIAVPDCIVLSVENDQATADGAPENPVQKSDAAGRVKFPPQENGAWQLLVIHEQGWTLAAVSAPSPNASLTLTLQPWSRIEGESRVGTKPDADSELRLRHRDFKIEPAAESKIMIYWTATARPSVSGGFAFERVPAGRANITKIGGTATAHSHWFTLQPGATTRVTVGGAGRPVAGKFIIPEKLTVSGATFSRVFFLGKTGEHETHYYTAPINSDGTFLATDIEPGDYSFGALMRDPDDPGVQRAKGERNITIPPAPQSVSDEPHHVPPILLD